MPKIAALFDAGQAVLSTFDLDEVLKRILAIAHDYFHLRNVAILLLNKEVAAVVRSVANRVGRGAGDDSPGSRPGITGASVSKKQPVYAPDVSNDSRYICAAQSTRSELAIPLMVRDEVVGVLDCQSDQLNYFGRVTIRTTHAVFDPSLHRPGECAASTPWSASERGSSKPLTSSRSKAPQ